MEVKSGGVATDEKVWLLLVSFVMKRGLCSTVILNRTAPLRIFSFVQLFLFLTYSNSVLDLQEIVLMNSIVPLFADLNTMDGDLLTASWYNAGVEK